MKVQVDDLIIERFPKLNDLVEQITIKFECRATPTENVNDAEDKPPSIRRSELLQRMAHVESSLRWANACFAVRSDRAKW